MNERREGGARQQKIKIKKVVHIPQDLCLYILGFSFVHLFVFEIVSCMKPRAISDPYDECWDYK